VIEHPYYPIVYIRGYAGNDSGVEATVGTPFMGFNVGSTKLRQTTDPRPLRHYFESPLIRLMKDHDYRDVYQRGDVIVKGEDVPARSVWIFRYYDQVSGEFSDDPERPEMETYGEQLAAFLEQIRDLVCGEADPNNAEVTACREAFRVYLVAHSMGGLIARTYLQHVKPKRKGAVEVDKVFTYGTPHSGIDLKLVGNLLTHLPFNNADNFNRNRMREYLDLGRNDKVNSLGGHFPPERFFCVVGTNHRDYGLPRHAVGEMSDGLVRIRNAYVQGAPRAFVHRAHSGDYGIVNSEEGYQNLRRFLFGNDRVDILLDVDNVTLPPDIWEAADANKKIEASYHFEVIAKVRGNRWDLHSRTVEQNSAMFVRYERIKKINRPMTLASGFLMYGARVNDEDPSMGFSVDVRLLAPEYKVDGFLWMDNFYEGGYVFRDKFNFDLVPGSGDEPPVLRYGCDSQTTNRATTTLEHTQTDEGGWEYKIDIEDDLHPMLVAKLIIRSSPWNRAPQ
jgi:pimeloyl-ACP methyl ester carboxylesterase